MIFIRTLLLLALLIPFSLFAAYLEFEPVTVVQPDGDTLHLYASGDEFYNWLHDKDGYTIMRNPKNGYWVYAKLVFDKLEPTGYNALSVNPAAVGLQKWIKEPDYVLRNIRNSFYFPPDGGDAPKTGSINNLVVFIRFKNEAEFTDSTAYYDRLFNDSISARNSMINYFREVSYNQLSIRTKFYPQSGTVFVLSFQDTAHTRGYFQPYDSLTNNIGYTGGNNGSQRTLREHTLLKDAITFISSQVPAGLNLDGDNDGKVDNVCFIIDGATTAWSTLLWPHRWSLYSFTVNLNGKRVYDYNFQLQSSLKSSGVGVLCHEMFHSLGAPDLYHYTSNGITPVSSWDIMESDQNPPQHMGAYMKYKYGNWISSIPVISTGGVYSLKPLNDASGTGNCFRINSDSSSQYYVIEYRKRTTTFESKIPGAGLLVYRINTIASGNASGPPDEVYIYRPNGTVTVNGSPSTANFSSSVSRTIMNPTTNPAPFYAYGSMGKLSIYGITDTGTTISFSLASANDPPDTALIVSPANGKTNTYKPNLTLRWNAGAGQAPTGYKIYFGTNNPPTNIVNGANLGLVNSYIPSVDYNTKYYWKIVPFNANGEPQNNPVWNFTTQPNPNYGGGQTSQGNYYFANSTPDGGSGSSQPIYNWLTYTSNEITSWTSGSGDDGYFTVPDIGFNFNYFGNTYRLNNVFIGTNGFISFGTGSNLYSYVQLPNTSAPNNIIAGAWRDLDCRNSTYSDAHVYYGGDASKFVVTYWHVHKYNDANNYITFQIILFSNGNIKIQYNDSETYSPLTNLITFQCSVGIENSGGTQGVNYRYATSTSTDTTVIGGPMFGSPLALEFGQNESALPVELSSFVSSVTGRNVLLVWTTERENNNFGFEIERKKVGDIDSWLRIASVEGGGNVLGTREYSYKDINLQSGKYYYRLKQIDFNGNSKYYDLASTIEIGIPVKFDLSQNYPNPFNPVTKINYDIPVESRVKLQVFDVTGKKVYDLVNTVNKAGYYSVEFNASALSSGIYFYRIYAESQNNVYVKTLKMILLK